MLRLMLEHSLWLHLKVAIDVIILLLLLLPVSADVVVDVFFCYIASCRGMLRMPSTHLPMRHILLSWLENLWL